MDFKYNDIKEKMHQLEYYLLTDSHLNVNVLDLVRSIKDTLENSVIIPKDQLKITLTEEQSGGRLCSVRGTVVGPSEHMYYDSTDPEVKAHQSEFNEYLKDELKRRLIDYWRY